MLITDLSASEGVYAPDAAATDHTKTLPDWAKTAIAVIFAVGGSIAWFSEVHVRGLIVSHVKGVSDHV